MASFIIGGGYMPCPLDYTVFDPGKTLDLIPAVVYFSFVQVAYMQLAA